VDSVSPHPERKKEREMDLPGSEYNPITGSFEHDNKSSASIKGGRGDFLTG
jgi:hypothetical protein